MKATFEAIPEFKTKSLLLRAISISDAPSYKKYFVDYEVIRHLSAAVPWPYPEDGVADFINKVILPRQGIDRWSWALCFKEAPSELIGVVDLWRAGRPENRGFWLGKKYWGQGLMTEAIEPVTNYAFTSLKFDKLVFANAAGNKASRRIKEKSGARLVRVEPANFVDFQYTEQEVWELSKREWLRGK